MLLDFDTRTECIPLGNEPLDCARRGEEHELDIVLGTVLADLRAGLPGRFAHHAGNLHGRCAAVSTEHVCSF
jgi:hypothetical protein